jgi:beta-glucosidase
MKLIPVISPRLGGRRARRMPPPAIIAASLSVLFPPAAAALASTAPASTAPASTAPASTVAASTVAASPSCPWLNQSLPISRRVHLLLSKMTLANEITMVEGQGTSQPYVFYMAAQPSLCIPAMGLEDGPLGVGDGLTGVTQLPSGASLAATFDASLARRYGAVIGQEEWGKGAAVNLGPTVNILRDPRWGRSFEAFTEDPFLNAALAVSEIRGVQAQGEMSQVKHFAAYNQETNRNTPADDVIVSNRTLHEIYLPAFQQAVTRAKAASVMCAYSVINGNFACQNPYLVSRIATEMFRFGIFNHPPTGTTGATVTTPAHQAVAARVAEDGTVLLKDDGGVLPLPAAHAGPVAVIGPAASAAPTPTGGGSAFVIAPFSVTPLQGLQAAAGPGTSVVYQQGLPTDTSLPAIPASALSPAYAPTPLGGSYTGTLTAPVTGTYVLAITNPCGCCRRPSRAACPRCRRRPRPSSPGWAARCSTPRASTSATAGTTRGTSPRCSRSGTGCPTPASPSATCA